MLILKILIIPILVLLQDHSTFVLAQGGGIPDLFLTDPESTTIALTTSHSTTAEGSTTTAASTTTTTTAPPFPVIRTRRTTTQAWLPQLITAASITTTGEAGFATTLDNFTTTTAKAHTNADFELTLKACCGSQCTTYDNLMSMVGLQCCGDAPMNAFEKICCNNQIHLRHAGAKYFDRCCGDKPYAWDQVCCRGKVYDGVPQASCCGDVPYSIYDRTSICCGEQLHKIPPNTGSAVCCGESMYDDRAGTHFCCGEKLYSRLTHNGCCHPYPGIGVEFPAINSVVNPAPLPAPPLPSANQRSAPATVIKFNIAGQRLQQSAERRLADRQAEGYNSTAQMCCDRVYDRREYDFCCYVADVNAKQWTPPVPRPYSSKTHCCDGMTVLEMDPKTKTCVKR